MKLPRTKVKIQEQNLRNILILGVAGGKNYLKRWRKSHRTEEDGKSGPVKRLRLPNTTGRTKNKKVLLDLVDLGDF